MNPLTVDQAFELVESWHRTLGNHLRTLKAEVEKARSEMTPLPPGCASRGELVRQLFSAYGGLMTDDCREIAGCLRELLKAARREHS